MISNSIPRVLSILEKHGVSFLLMGGQACILYGAAEFSRDMDVTVLASPENLDRLRSAVDELEGEVIAIPPFENVYLERGHLVHFWCRAVEDGIRLDVMTRMRGVADFPELWARRSRYPDQAREAAEHRAAVAAAQTGDEEAVQQALDEEMARARGGSGLLGATQEGPRTAPLEPRRGVSTSGDDPLRRTRLAGG